MFDTKRLLNIGLRLTTLGTRFAFIFILAKYLSADSVGYYGLFTAAVGYALLGVGLDFYTFSTREILRAASDQRGRMLKSQAATALAFYFFLMPLVFVFLWWTDWPGYLSWWFIPILILEHLNQELYRLLIVLSEQLTASLLLFVRQGSWAIVAVILMSLDASNRHLDIVMLLWACAGVAAAALGIWKLRLLHLGGWYEPVDWSWIRKGITVSTTFVIASLALRGVQTVDRYWLEAIAGLEIVGAYILFFGAASALMVFLDAAVFSFSYPELISHHQNNENNIFRQKVRTTLYMVIFISILFLGASSIILPYLLKWIGRSIYLSEMNLYYWIFAATVVNAIGMVPHYALYAHGRDRSIIASHIAALPVFGLSTWFLSHAYNVIAVPIGVFVALSLVMIWKTIAYLRVASNDQKRHSSAQL